MEFNFKYTEHLNRLTVTNPGMAVTSEGLDEFSSSSVLLFLFLSAEVSGCSWGSSSDVSSTFFLL